MRTVLAIKRTIIPASLRVTPDEISPSSMRDQERRILACERSLDLCGKHGHCLLWRLRSHLQPGHIGIIDLPFWAIELACDESDECIKKPSFVHSVPSLV